MAGKITRTGTVEVKTGSYKENSKKNGNGNGKKKK